MFERFEKHKLLRRLIIPFLLAREAEIAAIDMNVVGGIICGTIEGGILFFCCEVWEIKLWKEFVVKEKLKEIWKINRTIC